MTQRSTFYGLIAAISATVASGLAYAGATSRLAAFREIGEGTPQENRSVLVTTDLAFWVLVFTAILAVALLWWFIALRRRDARPVA